MTGPEFRDAYQQHKHLLYRFARRLTGSGIYNLYVLEDPDWRPKKPRPAPSESVPPTSPSGPSASKGEIS